MKNLLQILRNISEILKKILGLLPPIKVNVVEPIEITITPNKPIMKNKKSLLDTFCLAIQKREGWYIGSMSYRNKNPGNCKGLNGKFLQFSTYEKGFDYLKDYVRRAENGTHKAYPYPCTIKKFFSIYAPVSDNNDPLSYATEVAKTCELSIYDNLDKVL